MNETDVVYLEIKNTYRKYEVELSEIDRELDHLGRYYSTLVVKTIRGNKYYYEQWREGNKIKSKCICKFAPGAAAKEELKISRRQELLKRHEELSALKDVLQKNIKELDKIRKHELEDYSFEVMWKDELSARVSVKGNRVHVSRYIIHPVKQIFCSDSITRDQLNEILKLRCFEEDRSDTPEKLKHLGLTGYRPLDIVRKTHGVSYNDYLWIRFPGEMLCAKDVLVR